MRMKDNDLLVTQLFDDPCKEPITALSVYVTSNACECILVCGQSVLRLCVLLWRIPQLDCNAMSSISRASVLTLSLRNKCAVFLSPCPEFLSHACTDAHEYTISTAHAHTHTEFLSHTHSHTCRVPFTYTHTCTRVYNEHHTHTHTHMHTSIQ